MEGSSSGGRLRKVVPDTDADNFSAAEEDDMSEWRWYLIRTIKENYIYVFFLLAARLEINVFLFFILFFGCGWIELQYSSLLIIEKKKERD